MIMHERKNNTAGELFSCSILRVTTYASYNVSSLALRYDSVCFSVQQLTDISIDNVAIHY